MSLEEPYSDFLAASSWYAHAGWKDAGEAAYLALGLAGESGEFADEIKKVVRRSGFLNSPAFDEQMALKKKKLLLELGDPLWYLTRLCDYFDISLNTLRVLNTLKLYERMKVMHEQGALSIDLPEWPFDDYQWTYEEAKALWLDTFGTEVTGDE